MANNSIKEVILDCDPGHDDVLAILMVAAARNINLLGITTVAGNSYVENTYRNAVAVGKIAGLNVSVCKGMSRPLVREQIVAHYFHGESGLGGVHLPKIPVLSQKNALEFMTDNKGGESQDK